MINTVEDFWSKVDKMGPYKFKIGRCWMWIASRDRDGYGFFCWNNKQVRAHRFIKSVIEGGKY